MEVHSRSKLQMVTAAMAALLAMMALGCANFASMVGIMSGGSLVDAAYDGLEGQRVAVVCVSDSSSYSTGAEERLLARHVAQLLSDHVDDIEIVPATEVDDWGDKNGWNQIDYREVGQGVKADRVVAIDLEGFRLRQDPTLYKGRVNARLTVFDMQQQGKVVFRPDLPEITYPRTGVVHTTDVGLDKFRRTYIKIIADQLARHFYRYDGLEKSPHAGTFVLQ